MLILENDAVAASLYAIDGESGSEPNAGFYNVTLKNWATPWTNRDFDVFESLNDYSATIIGMVRDELDFRGILFDDTIYIGAAAGIPGYSTSSNAHYEQLELSGENLGLCSILRQSIQTAVTGIDAAGAAKAFFILGTNRAMFRYILVNHLCVDLE